MKSNYQRTADWLKACGKEPSIENFSVQLGCHLEEVAELLEAVDVEGELEGGKKIYRGVLVAAIGSLHELGRRLKNREAYVGGMDRVKVLDALCDMEVTGNGLAYLANMNKPKADRAVLKSNEAKLVDGKPVILEGGKIGKPEGWVAPDLSEFV